jgi:hypothetical protein
VKRRSLADLGDAIAIDCDIAGKWRGTGAVEDAAAANGDVVHLASLALILAPEHVPTRHRVQSPCAAWPYCRNVVAQREGRRG